MNKSTYINKGNDEIDLIGFFKVILKRWYIVLIAMIVGAAGLGGYKYKNDKSIADNNSTYVSSNTEQVDMEKRIEELENKLTTTQRAYVDNVLSYEEKIEHYREYTEKSVLMTIDPGNVIQWVGTFYVESDNINKALSAYQSYIESRDFMQKLIDDTGLDMEAKYLSELVVFSCDSLNNADADEEKKDPDDAIFKISLYASDENAAKELGEKIVELLKEYEKQLNNDLVANTLEVLDGNVNYTVDNGLADKQTDIYNKLLSLCTEKDARMVNFTNEQKELLNLYKGIKVQAVDKVNTNVNSDVKISVKYIVFGAVAGAFIVCCILFAIYIFDGKIHTINEIKTKYIIPVLGEQIIDIKNNAQFDYIKESIVYKLTKDNIKATCIVSSESIKADDKPMLEELADALKKADIDCSVCDNYGNNIDAYKTILDRECAILLEKINVSKFKNINNLLEIMEVENKNIVGMIVTK